MITNGTSELMKESDIAEIINEVREDLKEELESKHGIIENRERCEVSIIPFQFRQLLYNLISNSLKFSKPDISPVITITSKIHREKNVEGNFTNQGNYCHIVISDNGIGFDQQYNTKIFEVFQRLHGREKYNGTGIGLAIVKKIVENHNGYITAKGEPGKGATFDIYLPLI